MQVSAKTKLQPLEDADLITRDRDEDIRSRKVVDASGSEIGKVEELLVDDAEQKVRFLRISSGGFLGIGKSRVLVPVEAITSITEDEVRIDQTRDRVAQAPTYDPELVDENYYDSLYGYYGYTPFWGFGYVYPPYPHYPSAVR